MKERPILFSAPMVRAILDGHKTMTRRVVKDGKWWKLDPEERDSNGRVTIEEERWIELDECPYGKVGDRLWVRETWLPDPPADDEIWGAEGLSYVEWSGCGSSIDGVPAALRKPEYCIYRECWNGSELVWRPSIHMPRWASRITLEITDVRAERLQDISEADAKAEGIEFVMQGGFEYYNDYLKRHHALYSAERSFESLWESIRGAGSWQQDPYVWVISFRVMT